jgi:hypothetical protein
MILFIIVASMTFAHPAAANSCPAVAQRAISAAWFAAAAVP